MAASPTVRKTRYVRPANFASVPDGTDVSITFLAPADPTGASSVFHLSSDQDPSVSTPINLPPRGSVKPNLLAAAADSLNSDAGIVSVHLAATLIATNVFLKEIDLVDANGAVLDTIFSDTVGLDGGITNLVANALTGIPVLSGQGIKVTLHNGTGAPITGAPAGVARFDLGIDVQQPGTESVTKAL